MLSCVADSGVGRVFRRGLRVQWGKSPYRSGNAIKAGCGAPLKPAPPVPVRAGVNKNGGVSMDILVVAIWAVTVALFVLAVYHFTN
jgi:hypothetical protein